MARSANDRICFRFDSGGLTRASGKPLEGPLSAGFPRVFRTGGIVPLSRRAKYPLAWIRHSSALKTSTSRLMASPIHNSRGPAESTQAKYYNRVRTWPHKCRIRALSERQTAFSIFTKVVWVTGGVNQAPTPRQPKPCQSTLAATAPSGQMPEHLRFRIAKTGMAQINYRSG
jgi:hypothetical protein